RLTVTFYHDGVFVGPPLEYVEGNKDTIEDLNFGNLTYGKLFDYIKCSTLFPPAGLFYCLPGSDLSDEIRELKNEQQFGDFLAFPKDNDDLEDYVEDECELDDISAFVEPQFIGEEEVIIPYRCTSDPFLNRLCKTDPKKTTRNIFVYLDHDPDQPWKDMFPILGRKFKDHEEMKIMLANYGGHGKEKVAEGKGKEKVVEGKGKEKVAKGKGKEKVAKGSKVAEGKKKWTKQAIKLSKSPSKKGTKRKTSDNVCKFRLWGGLIEHYGRLWDYKDQLLKPTLDQVLSLMLMKSHVVKPTSKGSMSASKKSDCLDGCFLKGTIKRELLAAMGRDANNQMFPIGWAVVTVENKDNWLWFLVSLGDDLNLNRGATVTIISDGHKYSLGSSLSLLVLEPLHGEKDEPSISAPKPINATTEFVDDTDFASDSPTDGPTTVEMVNATKDNFDEDELVKFQELLLDAEKPLYEGCPDFTKLSAIVKLLNLKGYKKIHVCINNCLLYWKGNKDLTACRTCGISRWKIQSISEDLRWHATRRITDGVLRHPADSQAWYTIDEKFPKIAKDTRNLRLGISADGVDVNTGNKHHSVWTGVDTYDAPTKDNFNLRAIVLWTINDYPALGTLYGCPYNGFKGGSFVPPFIYRLIKHRYVVPAGRVVVPTGRYVVPAGKVIIIVSPSRLSLVPTGRILSPGRVK
ncbi:hypothetical protein Tco_0879967, partial [Tanacetum coccineum]